MADDPNKQQAKEEYDPAGKLKVDGDLFLPEKEDADESTDIQPNTGNETTPDEQEKNKETKPTQQEPNLPKQDQTTSKENTDPTGEGKEKTDSTTEGDRMYAGKYKTEDELKRAYQNLGGNADRFKSVEALEEAYDFRQGEYTRYQQEQAELQRLQAEIDEAEKTPITPDNPDVMAEKMMEQVDWDRVENAGQLGKQLLTIFMKSMPQNTQPPSEADLVEKIVPIIQEREKRAEELQSIERQVPRLTKDPDFRNAFAKHVLAEKQDRSYTSMKESMQSFLKFGQSIVQELQQQETQQTTMKQETQANTPNEHGQGMPGQGNDKDEADAIVGAYAARKSKFNGMV